MVHLDHSPCGIYLEPSWGNGEPYDPEGLPREEWLFRFPTKVEIQRTLRNQGIFTMCFMLLPFSKTWTITFSSKINLSHQRHFFLLVSGMHGNGPCELCSKYPLQWEDLQKKQLKVGSYTLYVDLDERGLIMRNIVSKVSV